MSPDAFARLAALPGVAEVCQAARGEIDRLLFDRALRGQGGALATEVVFAAAHSSAVLEGADISYEGFRSGAALDSSPIGRAGDASLRVQRELPSLVEVWRTAPLQALARLHTVAAIGFVEADQLGRPRAGPNTVRGDDPDDPLRLGNAPAATDVASRLDQLVGLLNGPTDAPALVVGAVVHGELGVLRPFAWGSGLVARAGGRLTLAARVLDPDFLVPVDAGIVTMGRPKYVTALRGFASGTPEGLAAWLIFHADAAAIAARQAHTLLTEMAP